MKYRNFVLRRRNGKSKERQLGFSHALLASPPMTCLGGMKRSGGQGRGVEGREEEEEDPLRALRTLSRRKVKGACREKLCEEPWKVYRGWLEGEDVVVHVLGRDRNVDDVARKMLSVSHRHVAKVIGWCRKSRSIVVEGESLRERLVTHHSLSWRKCCRIARAVASAAAYLATRSADVRIDFNLVWTQLVRTTSLSFSDMFKLVYIPGGSDSAVRSFGSFLKKLVEEPLQRYNAFPADDLNGYLKAASSALMELDQLADTCGSTDPPSIEEIEAKTADIVEKGNEKLEDILKGIRTLSQKQLEDAKSGIQVIQMDEISGYRGTLEGNTVLVLIVKTNPNYLETDHAFDVGDMAWYMQSISHRHVAKVIGWCEDSRSIVVEWGEGGSLKDRFSDFWNYGTFGSGLPWQDFCKMANQVASVLRHLEEELIVVRLDPEMILFGDTSKLVYLPPPPSEIHLRWDLMWITERAMDACVSFGMMLSQMLVGPIGSVEEITSQAYLKENVLLHVKSWPDDVVEELTRLAVACIECKYGRNMSRKQLAEDMDRIAKIAMAATQNDVILVTPAEQIAHATDNFSSNNLLEKGEFAEVYKCKLMGMEVAIKKYPPEKAIRSFQREVQIMHSFRHPNVLGLIGVDCNRRYLVSKFMAGGSLQERLEKDPSSLIPEDRVRICQEMASAVSFLHSKGVVHRNLKAANVLLDEHNKSRICGLGSAVQIQNSESFPNAEEGYIAKLASKIRCISEHSDIYALGLNIILVLAGEKDSSGIFKVLSQSHAEMVESTSGDNDKAASGKDSPVFHEYVERFCSEYSHIRPETADKLRLTLNKIFDLLHSCLKQTWNDENLFSKVVRALGELETIVGTCKAKKKKILALYS